MLTFIYYLIVLYVLAMVVWVVIDTPDLRRRVDGALVYMPLLLRVLLMK